MSKKKYGLQLEIGCTYYIHQIPVDDEHQAVAFKLVPPCQPGHRTDLIYIRKEQNCIFPICKNNLEALRNIDLSNEKYNVTFGPKDAVEFEDGFQVVVLKIFTQEKYCRSIGMASSSEEGREWLRRAR